MDQTAGVELIQPKFSKSQLDFIYSKAQIVALIGPQREGKTYAGFYGLAVHASRFGNKTMRGAIVRDTFLNLENTTRPSIIEASHNQAVFYAGGRKFRFLNAEIDMFGVDDLASLSKFQGAGYSFVWLEEPAPMEGRDNAGLQRSVFDVALSRIGSQRDAIPRLQITMNPADEDHWTYEVLILNPINTENYKTHVIHIPYESNPYIKAEQREAVKLAYKDNPAHYQRYVEGKFSYIQDGEAVTPEYNEAIHRSRSVLLPNKQFDTFRFWDGRAQPDMRVHADHPKRTVPVPRYSQG